jgi:membrane protein
MVLVAGGSINFILGGLKETWVLPGWLDPSALVSVFVIISPYLIWWLLFSWAYAYFSRGLIRWPERLLGGFITGLAFQVFQTFIIFIMFSLTSYNAIYTGFAFIPLFMIWIYTSWMIVLSGAELTRRLSDFFVTRRNLFTLVSPATWVGTLDLSRRVLAEIIKNYQSEPCGGPTSFRNLSRSTGAPLPALGAVINRLLAVDLVVRISGPTADDGPSFLPARSPELMTDQYIVESLEKGSIAVYN